MGVEILIHYAKQYNTPTEYAKSSLCSIAPSGILESRDKRRFIKTLSSQDAFGKLWIPREIYLGRFIFITRHNIISHDMKITIVFAHSKNFYANGTSCVF